MYYFVNSMITVSAIVFLYAPDNKPASLAILNMDDNGDLAPAAAMALILFAMNIAVRGLFMAGAALASKRSQKWRNPGTQEEEPAAILA